MWSIIILAIVQGLTEFFPVSSSGHLSLIEKYFFFHQQEAFALSLALHLGTLLSVLVFYKKIFFFFFKTIKTQKHFIFSILLACTPTAIIGFLLKDSVKNMLFNTNLIALFFITTAGILLLSHFFCQAKKTSTAHQTSASMNPKELFISLKKNLSPIKVFFIGCVQGLSIFPGLSRSGLTIATGKSLGLSSTAAGFFSFALMIPVVLGAALLEFSSNTYSSLSSVKFLIGFLLSFLTGLAVLKALQYILIQDKFYYFSYYLLLLGAVILLT